MKTFLRKAFLPWTAGACFPSEEEYQAWLQRFCRVLTDLRAWMLAAAAVCLLAGYFLDRRPLMLLCIAPLVLVLLLSMALGRTEAVLENRNEENKKE